MAGVFRLSSAACMIGSALLLSAAAQSAEPQLAPGPTAYPTQTKPNFYLITDYLPLAVFEYDNVVGSFRVENTTKAEAKLELVVTPFDNDGKAGAEQVQPLAAPAGGFGQVQGFKEVPGCSKIQFAVRKGTEVIGSVTVRLVRANDAWLRTKISSGRLVAADSGDIVIPVVVKRLQKEDRAFAPLKWMLRSGAPALFGQGKALLFIPERWRLNTTGYPETILLGPYDASSAPPVLGILSQVLNEMASRQAGVVKEGDELAVLLVALPPEDLDIATEPRVYRQLVETMLAHLEGMQLKRVVIVPPFQYGIPGKYSEALWTDVRAAASAYGAGTVDPADYMDEKLWRADPKVEGVYGVRPNSAGLKKIEQGLLNLVR